MDILNITACICVVLLHCNHQINIYKGSIDFPYIWGVFVNSVAFWPVPVFMMLSCCNLLNSTYDKRTFYKKRFYRTGIPFIAWSFIYIIINTLILGKEYTSKSLINDFFTGNLNPNMWFMIPLFCFYIMLPFISILYKQLSNKQLLYFIVISFLLNSLYPYIVTLFNLETLSQQHLFSIGENFITIGIAGYWIGHNEISMNNRRKIYLIAFITIIAHFLIFLLKTQHDGIAFRQSQNYSYPISIIVPIAVFIYFKYTNWEKLLRLLHINKALVAKISSCSFGIYLVHNAIQKISLQFDIPHLPFVNHYIGFIVTYITSLLVIYLMKKIPIIKKIVP